MAALSGATQRGGEKAKQKADGIGTSGRGGSTDGDGPRWARCKSPPGAAPNRPSISRGRRESNRKPPYGRDALATHANGFRLCDHLPPLPPPETFASIDETFNQSPTFFFQ
uniref:Uncharacterized protein n=1 Tax=Plectus sambesii TaxID=2011161 RepID=A0A914X6F1_9BILA